MIVTEEQAEKYTKYFLIGVLCLLVFVPVATIAHKITTSSRLECSGVVVATGKNMSYSEGSWKFNGGSYTPKLGEVCYKESN